MDYPNVPGVLMKTANPYPGVRLVLAVNNSGTPITAGDVVIFDATAANNVPGQPIPVTITTTTPNLLAAGVVALSESTVPHGATFWLQVAGLSRIRVNNTGGQLDPGDWIGTSAVAKVGTSVTGPAMGIYVDAVYNSAAPAMKNVYLVNPLGL